MTKETKLLIYSVLGYIVAALIFILPIGVVILLMIWLSHAECDTFAAINPDFDVMWVKYNGCMVKYNGMFISIDDVVNVLVSR